MTIAYRARDPKFKSAASTAVTEQQNALITLCCGAKLRAKTSRKSSNSNKALGTIECTVAKEDSQNVKISTATKTRQRRAARLKSQTNSGLLHDHNTINHRYCQRWPTRHESYSNSKCHKYYIEKRYSMGNFKDENDDFIVKDVYNGETLEGDGDAIVSNVNSAANFMSLTRTKMSTTKIMTGVAIFLSRNSGITQIWCLQWLYRRQDGQNEVHRQ